MHSIESGTHISVALFLSLSFTPDSMDNCNSSSMPKEKTKQAISLPMDKDMKTATSLPMLKEEIKLVPCVVFNCPERRPTSRIGSERWQSMSVPGAARCALCLSHPRMDLQRTAMSVAMKKTMGATRKEHVLGIDQLID